MTTLSQTLDAMRADLAAAFPEVASCEVHRGRFTLDELGAASFRTPAFRLALMGVPRLEPVGDGTFDATLRLSLCVVTTDERAGKREEIAAALIDGLLPILPERTWGLPDCWPPSDIAASNLFSGPAGRRGVLLWEVTWSQALRIGASDYPPETGALQSVHAGHAPKIGADHEQDYVLIAGGDPDA